MRSEINYDKCIINSERYIASLSNEYTQRNYDNIDNIKYNINANNLKF